MGKILKFPTEAAKFGYKRVKKRKVTEHPGQLQLLFPALPAAILSLTGSPGLFEQALMLDERGDGQAAALYIRAIAGQDCVAEAYCNLGILESQKGETAKAFDCFTISLKHNPRQTEAHYNLGNLYFELNDFRLAQIHYEMAAEVDASFANVFFNLALVQSINKDLAAAIKSLTQYQQLASQEEARNTEQFLDTLRKSLVETKNSQVKV